MSSRDRDTSPRRNKNNERSSFESSTTIPPNSEEQLDLLVRSILSRTLSKFDPPQSKSPDSSSKKVKDNEERHSSSGSQNNELARILLGQVAQFALNRYLKSKRKKATKRAADAGSQGKPQPETWPKQTQMPFLFGSGGRPLGSGERERMQRRRESSRSAPYESTYDSYNTSYGASYSSPYTGNEEIHLTDPVPPEPVPITSPPYLPPRVPIPEPKEPKLRRRRRHHNLSGRNKDEAADGRPPLVIPPSPEKPLSPPLTRSYTWDSTPNYPQTSRYGYSSYDRPQSRSPYQYHPNYPMHDGYTYSPQPAPESRRRRGTAVPTSLADLPTPPLSPYIPSETPREQQRRRDSERDAEREQRRRDREYDKDRRQRKGGWPPADRERESRESRKDRLAEKERLGKARERERISLERSREAALAVSLDDFLVQIRKTDDIVYRNMYRPVVDHYDRGDRGRDRDRDCCRNIIMQSGNLQRSLARSRSSAQAVRELLDVPLVEDRRRRRRATVHFEETM